jgi:hypothetical protein
MPADQAAKVSRIRYVLLQRLKPQHDIRKLSVSIGRFQRNNRATVVRDRHFNAVIVRQSVKTDILIIRNSKLAFADLHR